MLKIATWNINSVRLRLAQVKRFLAEQAPDILCLQETKCPDDRFPIADLREAGYGHIAINGQKGYHGVAVISRLPLERSGTLGFGGKADARHVAVTLGLEAGACAGLTIHNFYVPAGGDLPDPAANPKFGHKLAFLEDMRDWGRAERPGARKAILVGDLNVAPLENDVWSHKQMIGVVSHTPGECARLTDAVAEGAWVDAVRALKPEPERVYTWWSYRAQDWQKSDRGRRLDHVWLSQDLRGSLAEATILRPTRGWERPSDHVPVMIGLDA